MNMMTFSFDSRPIQTIMNQIKNRGKRDSIDLQPDYQRGFIWNNEFKDKLIYSIVKGYPIGNISLRIRNELNNNLGMQEVVDGQQRLHTIYDFINENYTVQNEYAREIIKYVISYMDNDNDKKKDKMQKRLNTKGKLSLKYEQLPDVIKENILSYNISITNIANSDDDSIGEYFRFLQNQERLRAGEIINSVPDTILEKYMNELDNKDLLLKKLSFSNNRRQFDKLFYGIVGLLDGNINFGTIDKSILDYATSCTEVSSSTDKKCKIMINELNVITANNGITINYINSNTRFMKFLLLLSSLELVDFKIETLKKISALSSINDKLSAFNSAKADSLNIAFNGYSEEVIEEYRLIALISKGGHSLKRVENRMEILAYYINNIDNKIKPSGIKPL